MKTLTTMTLTEAIKKRIQELCLEHEITINIAKKSNLKGDDGYKVFSVTTIQETNTLFLCAHKEITYRKQSKFIFN